MNIKGDEMSLKIELTITNILKIAGIFFYLIIIYIVFLVEAIIGVLLFTVIYTMFIMLFIIPLGILQLIIIYKVILEDSVMI